MDSIRFGRAPSGIAFWNGATIQLIDHVCAEGLTTRHPPPAFISGLPAFLFQVISPHHSIDGQIFSYCLNY